MYPLVETVGFTTDVNAEAIARGSSPFVRKDD
jgi:hypothetical protein